MVNKPFLLLGLAAEYRYRRRRRWCDKHCSRADHQMFMTLTGELSWQRLRRSALTFTEKKRKKIALVVLNFFRYLLWLRRYERKSVEVGVFRRGWVTLSADFRGKGASPTNHCWYRISRVIALSCGIKISAVRHLVLSQSTRVTDRRTDRITTPKTALAYARAVKTGAPCIILLYNDVLCVHTCIWMYDSRKQK